MLDWLRLIRASGLCTIVSNVATAAVVGVYAQSPLELKQLASHLLQGNRHLLWVPLASMLLYASGMLWNDLADLDRDRRLHPARPLPSGRINPIAAYIVGAILPVAALLVASLVGPYGFYAAGVVLSLALLYNFATKHVPWLGSLTMAGVRLSHACFAFLILGIDHFRLAVAALLGLVGWEGAAVLPLGAARYPLILGTYIFGLTLISELESRPGRRWELVFGGLVLVAAIVAATGELFTAHWIVQWQQAGGYIRLVAALFLGLGILAFLCWRVLRPWLQAVRLGRRALIGPIVGSALGGIILLDALVATAFHPVAGLGILLLYPLFRLIGRAMRMD